MPQPQINGRYKRVIVTGVGNARKACKILIEERSAQFLMTPYPDDEWCFEMKDERHAESLIERFGCFIRMDDVACEPADARCEHGVWAADYCYKCEEGA